jgi:hypothetical protein
MSRGSANDAQKVMDMLNDYKAKKSYKIYWGINELEGEVITSFSRDTLPFVTDDNMINLVHAGAFTDGEKHNARTLQLNGRNEKELQTFLTTNCTSLNAVDTHSSAKNVMEFMFPRKFGGEVVYTNTGKSDLTSSVRKMLIEVKSSSKENALIVQMLERLCTSMDISHVLRNSIVFGATPQNGFVFIATRQIPVERSDTNQVSLYMFRVELSDLLYMWQLASNIDDSTAYLTTDAPLLLHSLDKLGYVAWLCRVRLLDWSQHRVYAITLPEKIQWPDSQAVSSNESLAEANTDTKGGRLVVGVRGDSPHFAVKIVCIDEEFQRELGVLDAVKPSYFISGISWVGKGKGKVSRNKGARVHAPESTAEVFKQHAGGRNKIKSWWSLKQTTRPLLGGALVMHVGENIPEPLDDTLRRVVFHDCIISLRPFHEAGYLHTDLRLPNLLKFQGKYQPVDFGDAVKTGALVNVDDFSQGRKQLLAAANNSTQRCIKWNIGHDIEMLSRAVFAAPILVSVKEEEEGCVERMAHKRSQCEQYTSQPPVKKKRNK